MSASVIVFIMPTPDSMRSGRFSIKAVLSSVMIIGACSNINGIAVIIPLINPCIRENAASIKSGAFSTSVLKIAMTASITTGISSGIEDERDEAKVEIIVRPACARLGKL